MTLQKFISEVKNRTLNINAALAASNAALSISNIGQIRCHLRQAQYHLGCLNALADQAEDLEEAGHTDSDWQIYVPARGLMELLEREVEGDSYA